MVLGYYWSQPARPMPLAQFNHPEDLRGAQERLVVREPSVLTARSASTEFEESRRSKIRMGTTHVCCRCESGGFEQRTRHRVRALRRVHRPASPTHPRAGRAGHRRLSLLRDQAVLDRADRWLQRQLEPVRTGGQAAAGEVRDADSLCRADRHHRVAGRQSTGSQPGRGRSRPLAEGVKCRIRVLLLERRTPGGPAGH